MLLKDITGYNTIRNPSLKIAVKQNNMILLKNTFWLLLTTLACLNATALNAQVRGCTDSKAANFNALATQNDGSCAYNSAIVDPTEAVNLESVLNESSGLIMWNNKLWTHNDDTDIHLYELSPADAARGWCGES